MSVTIKITLGVHCMEDDISHFTHERVEWLENRTIVDGCERVREFCHTESEYGLDHATVEAGIRSNGGLSFTPRERVTFGRMEPIRPGSRLVSR